MTANYYDRHFRDTVHSADCPESEAYAGPTHACAEGHGYRWQDFPPAVGGARLPEKCPLFDDWHDGRCGQPVRELECDGSCPTLQEIKYA